MPKASKLSQDLCHETCNITRGWSIINRTINLYVSTYRVDQHLQYHKRAKVINRTINLYVSTYRVDQHLQYHKRAKVISRTINLYVSTYRVDQPLQYHKRAKVISRTINLCVGTYQVDQPLQYHKRAKVISRTINLYVGTYRVDQWILGIHAGIQRCCQRLVGGGVHVKSTRGCTLQQVVKLLLPWWWVIPQLKDVHVCSSLAKHKT